MNVPDRDLENALRRQLSAAVNAVEPSADGLNRIRARTAKHKPQPWLLSVLSGAVTRARYWVWRGHWTWSGSRPQPRSLSGLSGAHAKRAPGTTWLRPVAVLAGVAFIATMALAVPPFRQAIVQVSNNLTGSKPSSGAGTDGNGSPAGNGGSGTLSTGARSTASAGSSGSQSAASRASAASSRCRPTATPSATAASGSAPPTSAVESTAPSAQPTACRTTVTTPTPTTSGTPTPTTSGTPTPTTTPSTTPTTTPTSTTAPTTTPTPTGTGTSIPSTSVTGPHNSRGGR